MNKTIEDVLQTLCSEVSLLSSNESQRAYKLAPKRDAQTAHNILNSFGIESKIYDESDHSRMYLSLASLNQSEDRINSSYLYAKTMRSMADTLNELCSSPDVQASDFAMNFMKNSAGAQTITITLSAANGSQNVAENSQVSAPPKPLPQPVNRPSGLKKHGPRRKEDTISNAGVPTIAKTYLMKDDENKGKEKDAMWRWLYNNLFRYFAENAVHAMVLIVLLAGLASIGIMSKAVICHDFMVKEKDIPWYCDKERLQKYLRGDRLSPR